MITPQKLQSIITSSSLPDSSKQALSGQVEYFGEYASSQLADYVASGLLDVPKSSKYYLDWVDIVYKVMAALDSADEQAVEKEIRPILLDPEYERGKVFLNLFYDIRAFITSHVAGSWNTVKRALHEAENQHFRFLAIDELRFIVQSDILYFIERREDILADFRWMYYVASPEYDGGEWGRQFLPLLKQSQEQLGQKILVGGAEVAPTVEHWLTEYDAFSSKPGPQRGALDRLRFVNESPNSKALGKDEQKVLLKLCELYDWFSDPYVTEAEVAEFEDISPGEQRAGLVHEVIAPPVIPDSISESSSAGDPESSLRGSGSPDVASGDDTVVLEEQTIDVPGANIQDVMVQTPLGVSEHRGLEVGFETGNNALAKSVSQVQSQPSPLDMNRIRDEAEANKKAKQAEIDAKLKRLRQKQ